MKYKIGDKVIIRKDLTTGSPYGTKIFVDVMKQMCIVHNYILTIKRVYEENENDIYVMEEDTTELDFSWTNQMIERLYTDTDTKFEAFLKEIVDGERDCDETYEVWSKICDLSTGECGDSKKETIQWLIDFYSKFVPKNESVKKMTKAEIETELGYKIEIVEE